MLTTFVGRFTSRTGEITLDPMVLIFTLGVSIVTGLLFGTLPALGSRVDLVGALKQGGGQAGDAGSRKRMQGALIVAQVAVSVMLLVGAGLLLASFYRLQRVETGYRSDGVLSAQIFGNFSRYPNIIDAARSSTCRCSSASQAQPGVSRRGDHQRGAARRRRARARRDSTSKAGSIDDPERRPTADVRVASAAILRHDRRSAGQRARLQRSGHAKNRMRVVVINKAMTRVLGRRGSDRQPDRAAGAAQPSRTSAAAGVVHDRRHRRRRPAVRPGAGDGGAGLRAAHADAVQLCRTGAGPHRRRSARRSATCCAPPCTRVDPNQPVENVQTLDDLRSEALAAPRLTATLLGVFAGARAARHARRHWRRDRDVGAAAHQGIRLAHGARRQPRQRADDGGAPGLDAGR